MDCTIFWNLPTEYRFLSAVGLTTIVICGLVVFGLLVNALWYSYKEWTAMRIPRGKHSRQKHVI